MGIMDKLLSTANLYSKLLVSKATKGFNDRPSQSLGDDEFYYSINRIYTSRKVKKMYFIKELPRLVDAGFLHILKQEIETKVRLLNTTYKTNKKCELVDVLNVTPYEMNFSTFKNRSRMNMWKRRYDKAMRDSGSNSKLDDMLSKPEEVDKRDRNTYMIESWLFIKESQDKNKNEFCKTNIILELVSDSDDMLNECEKVLHDYMFKNEIRISEVFLQSNEYNKSFTPVGNQGNRTLLAKMHPSSILTDSLINDFDVPTHGVVGDETGICFGTDIYSGLPIFYDLGKGSDAINFLLTASTGEGKSNFNKSLYSAFDISGYNIVTLDYEGDEYIPMGKMYDAIFFKVSGEESRYFNTIAIGDLTGINDIDKDLKNESVKTTERVFSLLLDERNGMTPHEASLYSDCVNRVYERFGVTDNPQTWHLSKGCTYFHLYGELVEMSKLDYYVREYGQHIKDMIIKLRTYFERDGINHSMFDHPINLDQLLGARHVIFSFGMKGADESLINKKDLALKQLFVGYITTLLANYNRSKGQLTVVQIEELQRYLNHSQSAAVVSNMVSGGRKRGMIMFLITNAPLQLLTHTNQNTKTTEEHSKNVDAILNNINAHIIGSLKTRATEKLAEFFNIEDALPHLRLINGGGEMKYSFLIHYKDEFTVVKYLINPSLIQTDLYATRRDKALGDESDNGAFHIDTHNTGIKERVMNDSRKSKM